jgi:DNA-binding beta-propeller fold protein YncE
MRHFILALTCAIAIVPALASPDRAHAAGPYRIVNKAQVGGEGPFDYVAADSGARRLYIARRGMPPKVTVFDLDTLAPAGEIVGFSGHGVAIDARSHHGFLSSKPVAMWDTRTLKPIKTIDVQGNPDGIMFDPFDQHVYIFSHVAPEATVIDTRNGSVVGTVDLGGAPEQAVSDGKGHVYVDVENMHNIAVVNAKTMKVTAHYELAPQGGACAGLAMDVTNRILFAACRNPQTMVVLRADDGKILTTLPIGRGTDGAVFNPNTMEAFSAQVDGTLTVVKEESPTSFTVEQTLETMPSAKTLTLDPKTNRIYLIGAKFPPAPPPPPQGSQRNPNPAVPGSFTILMVGR